MSDVVVHALPATNSRVSPGRAVLRLNLLVSLLTIDIGVVCAAVLLAAVTLGAWPLGDATRSFGHVVLFLYLAIGAATGAFSIRTGLDAPRSVGRALRTWFFAMVGFLLLAFALKASAVFSRLLLGMSFGYGVVGFVLLRYLLARWGRQLLGGLPWDVVLIVDDGKPPRLTHGFNAIVDARRLLDPTDRSPAMLDRLARAIGAADRVVVQCPPERRGDWAAVLRGANVQGELLAPEMATLRPYALSRSGWSPAIVVARGPLRLTDRLTKRVFDLAGAIASIILLWPILVAIAVGIRLTSDGPILFAQTRIGRQNRQFTMWKFRTMYAEDTDPAGRCSALRGDRRVTSLGRLLRAASLDELPQLMNVLRGDMSLVGPRPHALSSTAADRLFWDVEPAYWDRHAMKPGMTGLAQVRGLRGATLVNADLQRRLDADMDYIRNWSLWRDLLILARTVLVVVHRNAF